MELIINDVSFDITLYNTNFVDYWINRVFKNNNTIEPIFKDTSFINGYINRKKADIEALLNRIHKINETINKYSLEWIRPFPIEPLSQEWLCKLHEQWAETTLFIEKQEHKQYGIESQSLVTKLHDQDIKYSEVNPLVHKLEYINDNVRLEQLRIFSNVQQLSRNSKEYTVKANDTSFFKSNIVVPFHDVGRPQFEEWLLKKKHNTNETSNYINVSGRLDIYFLHQYRYPNDCIYEYKVYCHENNLEEWGPILNIGKFSNYTYMTNNLDKFWNAISNHKDITILIKK